HKDLLYLRHGFTAFALWSHKVFRWFVPHAMVVALLANLALAVHSRFFAVVLLGQCVVYALAALGLLGLTPRRVRAVADAAAHFVEMNAALLVGFVKYSRGRQGQTWSRTDRPARAEIPRIALAARVHLRRAGRRFRAGAAGEPGPRRRSDSRDGEEVPRRHRERGRKAL